MGARGGMEERLVPPHGYRTDGSARAARGKGFAAKTPAARNLLFSFWKAAGT